MDENLSEYKLIFVNNIIEITNISISNSTHKRPLALNTVLMLKIASDFLHISPQQAMHIAERLYLSGIVTYPRTETNK